MFKLIPSPDRTGSPEVKKPSFPEQKERPAEAPFWAWKTGFFTED